MIRAGRYFCETDPPYRKRLSMTLVAALILHFLVISIIPRSWWEPDESPRPAMVGPARANLEITSQFPIHAKTRMESQSRFVAGAMRIINIEIIADPEERHDHRTARPKPEVIPQLESPAETDPALLAALRNLEREGSPTHRQTTIIELGEDLSPLSASPQSAQSENFAILQMQHPEYPEISIIQYVEGRVRVRARVDTKGKVVDVWVVDSEVDLFCESSVKAAVKQWIFKPYQKYGRSVPFTVLIPFRFQLED